MVVADVVVAVVVDVAVAVGVVVAAALVAVVADGFRSSHTKLNWRQAESVAPYAQPH